MQVFFPMCWNNKTLDSPDHRSHMAYPTRYNSGDCPPTHPVRVPGIFYEAIYSVAEFPHGQGNQPFVLSNGDPTGYGFHGDFVSARCRVIEASTLHEKSVFSKFSVNKESQRHKPMLLVDRAF